MPRRLSGYVSYQRRNGCRNLKFYVARVGNEERPDGRNCQMPSKARSRRFCRDLSEQVKRMRQLQEQADELRTALREWACPGGAIVRTD